MRAWNASIALNIIKGIIRLICFGFGTKSTRTQVTVNLHAVIQSGEEELADCEVQLKKGI